MVTPPALIAATLPNPRRFNSANPSPYMRRRQAQIVSIMGKLMRIEMGYGANDDEFDTSKIRKRKKKYLHPVRILLKEYVLTCTFLLTGRSRPLFIKRMIPLSWPW